MKDNVKTFLAKSAYACYGLLYGFILLSVLFNNISFDYNIPVLLAGMAAFSLVLITVLVVYSKCSDIIVKHRYKLLAAVCAVIFLIQFLISSQMVPTVLYDYEKVLNGAIVWATKGNVPEFNVYRRYMQHYPHQMGTFLIQQLLFKISRAIGYTDFFMVACLAGQIMFCIMTVASFLYLDENINSHRAIFYLVITAMYFPMYFQSNVAYTDTYSVWGIPCILLFASRSFKAENNRSRYINAAISGVLAAVVMQIKTTAVIVMIALLIQMIVKGFGKKDFAVVATICLCILAVNGMFDRWANNTVLDKNNPDDALPVTHWIMMGLQGDGTYSAYDEWEITCSVPTEKRVEKNIEVIKERLQEMGPGGYVQLLYRKTCRTFGSGDAELYYTYLYEPQAKPINTAYEIIYSDGRFFPLFRIGSHAVYLLTMVLGVTGAFIIVFKKDKNLFEFAPHIALIGFWIFMMLWESNHRQVINQWSLFFITAAIGLYYIWQSVIEKLKK